MVDVLLYKIKKLENDINEIKEKNEYAISLIKELLKPGKINKQELIKTLTKLTELLKVEKNEHYFHGSFLTFNAFLDLVKKKENFFIVLVDANMQNIKQDYLLGYLTNKISPIFTIKDNIIFGVVEKDKLNLLKKTNVLPFYNPQTGEFDEIELFKVLFYVEKVDFKTLEKMKKIFKDFRVRPSYKNKHFIEYSLVKDKVVDFEQEELNKQKEKFSYIYDEKYPNLEVLVKKEIKNIPFILAVLERIDTELDEIKESKGIQNVVNRILNYIELNLPEEGVLEEVRFLRKKLSS
ncbi:hypothetical protein [Caminibacter pacificus]